MKRISSQRESLHTPSFVGVQLQAGCFATKPLFFKAIAEAGGMLDVVKSHL